MTDPVMVLLLLIVGPASICITTILGYLAFLHITKRYATQASNNVFDRLFDMLERRLPDIVEGLVMPKKQNVPITNTTTPPASLSEEVSNNLAEGERLLTHLISIFNTKDDTPVEPNTYSSLSRRSFDTKRKLDE